MSRFVFKQFALDIWEGVFPVTTDSILLGSWAQPGSAKNLLDIGTGSGILAAMLAQKAREAEWILGMDQDFRSIQNAAANFSNIPGMEKLEALYMDIASADMETFVLRNQGKFDLIVSNPPYFKKSLRPEDPGLAFQKHQHGFDFGVLARRASALLHPMGYCYVVIPVSGEELMNFHFSSHAFSLEEMVRIRHYDDAPVSLVLLKFGRRQSNPRITDLRLFEEDGRKSEQYAALTREYYLDDSR